MNFKRVIVFGVVLFLLRFVAAAAVGFFEVDLPVVSQYLLRYALDFLVVVLVFVKLGAIQSSQLSVHIFSVVAVSILLFLLSEITLRTQLNLEAGPDPLWIIEYINFLASMCIGTAIGKRMRVATP